MLDTITSLMWRLSRKVELSGAEERVAGRRVAANSPHHQDAAVVEQRCRMHHARDIVLANFGKAFIAEFGGGGRNRTGRA